MNAWFIVIPAILALAGTVYAARSNKTANAGANAIDGLSALADRTTKELERQDVQHKEYVAKCDTDRVKFATQISHQAGQIEVLKTIPLTNIDSTLQVIATANKSLAEIAKNNADTNEQILIRLDKSATTLAKDTKDAKVAAEEVKTDLVNNGDTIK